MIKDLVKAIGIIWGIEKKLVVLKGLQGIAIAIMTPLSIYLTQLLVDDIEMYLNMMTTRAHVFMQFSLLLLSLLFFVWSSFIGNVINISLQRKVNIKLSTSIANKFLKIEYKYFEDPEISNVIQRMGRNPQEIVLDIFNNTIDTLAVLCAILGTSIIFLQISVFFSVILLFIIITKLWLDYKTLVMMNSLFDQQSADERRLEYLSFLLNEKKSLFELRVFSATNYILEKWRDVNKKVLDDRIKTTIRSNKYFAISTILIISWTGFIIVYLIKCIYNSEISIGIFIALIESLGTILNLSENLSNKFSALTYKNIIIKYYRRFFELPEIKEDKSCHNIFTPHITFENVFFSYPGSKRAVLKGLSMEILPGQRVALVGENGEGKSTIIKLLCKLYTINSGRILINGIDINELSYKDIKNMFSVIFQDYARYEMSLRENVAFGDIERIDNDSEIVEALRRGMAIDLLEQNHGDLDINLGRIEDDGIGLSGGQWQRVAISRACFSKSNLVIFDEPTAALDPIAENELYIAFSSLLEDKGCIMISHRLASTKLADNIFVLKDGAIVESGSHKELMNRKGIYFNMFESQRSWYVDNGKEERQSEQKI
ncbi:MAG: ABC transporter ATP-binding protein [Emergencia sp.]|jgi:ABC-type multidrug transport system fused ATPase/permease subunit|nr:ABC transporter ATP-binding protein [Emergencia sp.]